MLLFATVVSVLPLFLIFDDKSCFVLFFVPGRQQNKNDQASEGREKRESKNVKSSFKLNQEVRRRRSRSRHKTTTRETHGSKNQQNIFFLLRLLLPPKSIILVAGMMTTNDDDNVNSHINIDDRLSATTTINVKRRKTRKTERKNRRRGGEFVWVVACVVLFWLRATYI